MQEINKYFLQTETFWIFLGLYKYYEKLHLFLRGFTKFIGYQYLKECNKENMKHGDHFLPSRSWHLYGFF